MGQMETPKKIETLEDYLSTSDSMSLLSLDLTNNSVNEPENSELSYVGFSAQSSAIPSISCDSALKKLKSESSNEKISSTSSSSPMISAPTSPDNDSVTAKKSSSSDEDSDQPTTAKVLSGIFETFDNLL